jgi:hypothetical protein
MNRKARRAMASRQRKARFKEKSVQEPETAALGLAIFTVAAMQAELACMMDVSESEADIDRLDPIARWTFSNVMSTRNITAWMTGMMVYPDGIPVAPYGPILKQMAEDWAVMQRESGRVRTPSGQVLTPLSKSRLILPH